MVKQSILKEEFVSSPTFGHIKEEVFLKVFPKLSANALLLSKIFAHQNLSKKNSNSKAISFVDLYLSSLLMYLKNKAVLITGNKKHFPSCIFDVIGVINFEGEDEGIRALSIVEFNQEKFDGCYSSLEKLKI